MTNPARAASDHKRFSFAVASIVLGAFSPVLFGWPGDLFGWGLLLIAAGVLAAGILGRTWMSRLVYVGPMIVAAFGAAVAGYWYFKGRTTYINYEILIPLLGGLPGYGLFALLKKWRDRVEDEAETVPPPAIDV